MLNFETRTQIIFHIILRITLLKFHALIIIWYPKVPCYLF